MLLCCRQLCHGNRDVEVDSLAVLPSALQSHPPTHHRITLPDDDVVGRLHSVDVSRQVLVDLAGAVTADERDFAGDAFWVDDCSQ